MFYFEKFHKPVLTIEISHLISSGENEGLLNRNKLL